MCFDSLLVIENIHLCYILRTLFLCRPANGLEGHYRFLLTGTDHVTVKCLVNEIFDLPQLGQLELFGQFVPGHQIVIQRNSTTSTWVDVCELIQAQDVDVFDKEGRPAHDTFLDFINHSKLEIPHAGKIYKNKNVHRCKIFLRSILQPL
jgi:hypothetical protein